MAKTTKKTGVASRNSKSTKESSARGRDSKSAAGSALTQHVSTRRTKDGKAVRVVLAPISSGSLKRNDVTRVVREMLAKRKK